MKNWNFRKTVLTRDEMPEEHRLAQSLSCSHLIALGVDAIFGLIASLLYSSGLAKRVCAARG